MTTRAEMLEQVEYDLAELARELTTDKEYGSARHALVAATAVAFLQDTLCQQGIEERKLRKHIEVAQLLRPQAE